jgi:hypothetical protein
MEPSSKTERAFDRFSLRARQLRCEEDGFKFEGLGTEASTPLTPGETVTFNVTATNLEEFDGDREFDATVDGEVVSTVAFEGPDFASIQTKQFSFEVPQAPRIRVVVGCMARNFDTTASTSGSMFLQSITAPSQANVGESINVSTTIGCRDGNCDRSDFRFVIDGDTVTQRSRFGPLDQGETRTVDNRESFLTPGTKTVEVFLNGSRVGRREINVVGDEADNVDGGGDGDTGGTGGSDGTDSTDPTGGGDDSDDVDIQPIDEPDLPAENNTLLLGAAGLLALVFLVALS